MSPRYLIPLALVFLMFGCPSQPGPRDAVSSALDRMSAVDSMVVTLDMNLTSSSLAGTTYGSAKVTQYVLYGISRSDMKVSGVPGLEDVDLRLYSLENGSYLCGKAYDWYCLEVNSSSWVGSGVAGLDGMSGRGRKLLDSGALQFIGGIERQEVNGRPCTLVSANINYSKVNEPWAEDLKNVRNAVISECLDDETGIPLREKLVTETVTENGLELSQTEFQVSSLEVNATVQDAMFQLPIRIA